MLSDILGNWPLLQGVVQAERHTDQILYCGDSVNYWSQPNESSSSRRVDYEVWDTVRAFEMLFLEKSVKQQRAKGSRTGRCWSENPLELVSPEAIPLNAQQGAA